MDALDVFICTVLCFCSILFLCGAQGINPLLDSVQRSSSLQRLDQCFCELRGRVDECCCDVETVDSLNNDHIHPLITPLVEKTYFKFFQVNLHRSCPFWPDDGRCVLKDCHVESCTEDELPAFLKGSEEQTVDENVHKMIDSCDEVSEEEQRLSSIDSTISSHQWEEFKSWHEYDMAEDNFCQVDVAEDSQELDYVDLTLNPERYTGYAGHSTERIWRAIYHENCFRPKENSNYSSHHIFNPSSLQGMCLEKRAFYRVISGLHASINIHLSARYIISDKGSNSQFGPNLSEFVRRFDAETTNGQGPSWLKNLYFAYLLVLRAVTKAEPYWKSYHFYTGDLSEEAEIKESVSSIVKAAKSCSSLFDESMMFTGNTSAQLKSEFKAHFKNISRIMDCVGCDKCRLWGKLQVQGVGTALKILFSSRKNGAPLHLSRTEIISLFNVLGRFSNSIHSLEMFKDIEANEAQISRKFTSTTVKEDL